MEKRLTFNEFKTSIDNRDMPLEKLPDYVEFDPESPIPKLSFRDNALVDQAPSEYDVDAEIYKMLRVLDEARETKRKPFSTVKQKRVVADGDSWFRLPWFDLSRFYPMAIAERIHRNGRVRIKNLANWGNTLEDIIQDKEDFLIEIDDLEPEYFMISAGGNDLQKGLAAGKYLNKYDPGLQPDKYLTPEGEKAFAELEASYHLLFGELTKQFSSLVILCYGYDYLRPLEGDRRWLGKYLKALGIPDDKMVPIMNPITDKLNEVVQRTAGKYTNVRYLNCRGITKGRKWFDDMHPDDKGFAALAKRFEAEMR